MMPESTYSLFTTMHWQLFRLAWAACSGDGVYSRALSEGLYTYVVVHPSSETWLSVRDNSMSTICVLGCFSWIAKAIRSVAGRTISYTTRCIFYTARQVRSLWLWWPRHNILCSKTNTDSVDIVHPWGTESRVSFPGLDANMRSGPVHDIDYCQHFPRRNIVMDCSFRT